MAPGSHRSRNASAKGVKASKLPGKNGRVQRVVNESAAETTDSAPAELQQRCLDIFRHAFEPNAEDTELVQEVKGHLYRRDFAAAFGQDDYLRAYASRWSPGRALGYLQVLTDLREHLLPQLQPTTYSDQADESRTFKTLRVASLGGGAGAEIVAIAGWVHRLQARGDGDAFMQVELDVVDIADWTHVVGKLDEGIRTPLPLSKYASQAKKDANRALLQPSNLRIHFHQLDALASDSGAIDGLVGASQLVTLMFTLNELYSTSITKTQQLLQCLKTSMPLGSLLLIVDSPGSYSTVSVNGADKKYPMHWLLDYVFVRASDGSVERDASEWDKVIEEESRWFRLPSTLTYPIELENMRYQMHLFKKCRESRDG